MISPSGLPSKPNVSLPSSSSNVGWWLVIIGAATAALFIVLAEVSV